MFTVDVKQQCNNNNQNLYYQGYILPYIDYGSIVWGAASSTNIERLTKLQKRAARIILHADYDTSSDQGQVVQSIVSLTSSLRGELVKCFTHL